MPDKWVEAQGLAAGSPILSLPIICQSWALSGRQRSLGCRHSLEDRGPSGNGQTLPMPGHCLLLPPSQGSVMDKQKTF